ncbi:MAG: hypothetical protein EA363_03785 [Balneolaceae bacterium]|nr:MAG: hypothetical protein EA363_03785 [Balneolaceae bacterium]
MLRLLKFSLILFVFASFAVTGCENDVDVPSDDELLGEEPPVPMTDVDDLPVNVPYVLPELSDEELRKFAQINFRAAQRELDPELDAEEYVAVIEDGGLSTARYREIYVVLQREPTVRLQVQEIMEELHHGQ